MPESQSAASHPDLPAVEAVQRLLGLPDGLDIMREVVEATPHVRRLLIAAAQQTGVTDPGVSEATLPGDAPQSGGPDSLHTEAQTSPTSRVRPATRAATGRAATIAASDERLRPQDHTGHPPSNTAVTRQDAATAGGNGPERRGQRPRHRVAITAGLASLTAAVVTIVAIGSQEPANPAEGTGTTYASGQGFEPSYPLDSQYDMLTPLISYLDEAAQDPSIAASYTPEGSSKAVAVNAVAQNPELRQALGTVIIYMGGNPYGFSQLKGVIPETSSELSQDIAAINVNRKAEGTSLLKNDSTDIEITSIAGCYRANKIWAKISDGKETAPFNARTFFTEYLMSLGYTGSKLATAEKDLVLLFNTRNDNPDPAYNELAHLQKYLNAAGIVLKGQRRAGL